MFCMLFCMFSKSLIVSSYGRPGKIKWILTKYETWFNFLLALFISEYRWDKWDLEKSSFKANQVLQQLVMVWWEK